MLASCAGPPRTRDAQPSTSLEVHDRGNAPAQVVLVVLDGVRHDEIFGGAPADALMPNLHRLARTRGALVGGPGDVDAMWATGPNFVSLPGYREIMTGSEPGDCQENDCEPLAVDTLADRFRARGAELRDVAVISSWEGIERAASRRPESVVVSCGRTHGHNREALATDPASAEALAAGEEAAPAPGIDDFRPDVLTARIALGYLARERPRFLFLGLGEPDEYGHLGDQAGYLASLRAADRVLGQIDELFEKTGAWKRDALLVVTTDHGRGSDLRNHGRSVPESGRVWLMAAGRRVARPTFAPSWRVLHLADVAPTILRLAGLAPEAAGKTGAPIESLLALGP
jgi:hypothetical protein